MALLLQIIDDAVVAQITAFLSTVWSWLTALPLVVLYFLIENFPSLHIWVYVILPLALCVPCNLCLFFAPSPTVLKVHFVRGSNGVGPTILFLGYLFRMLACGNLLFLNLSWYVAVPLFSSAIFMPVPLVQKFYFKNPAKLGRFWLPIFTAYLLLFIYAVGCCFTLLGAFVGFTAAEPILSFTYLQESSVWDEVSFSFAIVSLSCSVIADLLSLENICNEKARGSSTLGYPLISASGYVFLLFILILWPSNTIVLAFVVMEILVFVTMSCLFAIIVASRRKLNALERRFYLSDGAHVTSLGRKARKGSEDAATETPRQSSQTLDRSAAPVVPTSQKNRRTALLQRGNTLEDMGGDLLDKEKERAEDKPQSGGPLSQDLQERNLIEERVKKNAKKQGQLRRQFTESELRELEAVKAEVARRMAENGSINDAISDQQRSKSVNGKKLKSVYSSEVDSDPAALRKLIESRTTVRSKKTLPPTS